MRHILLRACVAAAIFASAAAAEQWQPIDQTELSRKTPRVDAAADAEAIFWDIRVEDRIDGGTLTLTLNNYVRIKIYTDRGKEQYSTVEIPRFGQRKIKDIAARTIKANGTIVELTKDAIFERELVKTKGAKLRGATFVLPSVDVGDVVEYRYREVREGEAADNMRLYFQRELPMWLVTYHLKPLEFGSLAMRSFAFHCQLPPFQKEPNGFFGVSMANMPAFKEEPDMPPVDQLRAWVLIYYGFGDNVDAEKFWKDTGKSDHARWKPYLKANDLVKSTAAELVSGIDKREDKLAALDLFCRTKIRNVDAEAYQMTAEQRRKVKDNKSPADTLKQKAGTGIEVDLLFAALANAAGFDARMARVPDRGDMFFTRNHPSTYFMEGWSVAVDPGDGKWIFFDPATAYLDKGMLRWQEEMQVGLVSDPKAGFFAPTQTSGPERSKNIRKGVFTLKDDGTLEGTVEYTYTGHADGPRKRGYREMTPEQQEKEWKETLQERLSTAELSEFSLQNATDPVKPIVIKHKVSVPGYAARTGKRILLQPAFFEKNKETRYTDKERKWDMYYHYAWTEEDEVTIELPDGWELDAPTAPSSTKLGDVGDYQVQVQKTTDGRKVVYRRTFVWGRDGKLVLPVKFYQNVKNVFDFVHDQDAYTISLRPAALNAKK